MVEALDQVAWSPVISMTNCGNAPDNAELSHKMPWNALARRSSQANTWSMVFTSRYKLWKNDHSSRRNTSCTYHRHVANLLRYFGPEFIQSLLRLCDDPGFESRRVVRHGAGSHDLSTMAGGETKRSAISKVSIDCFSFEEVSNVILNKDTGHRYVAKLVNPFM